MQICEECGQRSNLHKGCIYLLGQLFEHTPGLILSVHADGNVCPGFHHLSREHTVRLVVCGAQGHFFVGAGLCMYYDILFIQAATRL